MPLHDRGVKASRRVALCLAAAIFAAGVLWVFRMPRLPRVRLSDGSEFRVLQISYGTEHALAGAPRWMHSLWANLPGLLRACFREPVREDSGLSSGDNKPSLSIFWSWIDRRTGKWEIGPTDNVVMRLDNGERINLGWPDPGNSCRQIFVPEPPRNSRTLRFHVVVEEERVDFAIANPAFNGNATTSPAAVFPMPVEQMSEAEPRVECIAVNFPDPIRAPKGGGDFLIEYRLINQFSTDLLLVTEPLDHLTHEFRDTDGFSHQHNAPLASADARSCALVRARQGAPEMETFQSHLRGALISLPKSDEPVRGTIFVTIPVEGTFRDTGLSFRGAIDLTISVIPND
jgi:hypothetical protein